MEDRVRQFLEQHHSAVIVSLQSDGRPHVARVTLGLVDGKLWSSGTQDRLRTKHLRRDPRATLCVLDDGNAFHWLGLATTVRILDGPDTPQLNLALYRILAGEPDDVDEYLQAMVTEKRLIYEFEIEKAYGQF